MNIYSEESYHVLYRPVFRHYRVSRRHKGGFAIALETPVSNSLFFHVQITLDEKPLVNNRLVSQYA